MLFHIVQMELLIVNHVVNGCAFCLSMRVALVLLAVLVLVAESGYCVALSGQGWYIGDRDAKHIVSSVDRFRWLGCWRWCLDY